MKHLIKLKNIEEIVYYPADGFNLGNKPYLVIVKTSGERVGLYFKTDEEAETVYNYVKDNSHKLIELEVVKGFSKLIWYN